MVPLVHSQLPNGRHHSFIHTRTILANHIHARFSLDVLSLELLSDRLLCIRF
jgi:hypothetical protein